MMKWDFNIIRDLRFREKGKCKRKKDIYIYIYIGEERKIYKLGESKRDWHLAVSFLVFLLFFYLF